MLVRSLVSLSRALLFAALTVALVATGFGHRIATPQDQALVLTLATGATSADFCGDTGPDDHAGQDCLACQITGTAALPPRSAALAALVPSPAAPITPPRDRRIPVAAVDPAHRPQGPPALA